jgi:hypothetical protein
MSNADLACRKWVNGVMLITAPGGVLPISTLELTIYMFVYGVRTSGLI